MSTRRSHEVTEYLAPTRHPTALWSSELAVQGHVRLCAPYDRPNGRWLPGTPRGGESRNPRQSLWSVARARLNPIRVVTGLIPERAADLRRHCVSLRQLWRGRLRIDESDGTCCGDAASNLGFPVRRRSERVVPIEMPAQPTQGLKRVVRPSEHRRRRKFKASVELAQVVRLTS